MEPPNRSLIDISNAFLNNPVSKQSNEKEITPKDIEKCYSHQNGKIYTYLSRLMTFAKKGIWLNDNTISQVLQTGKTASLAFTDGEDNNRIELISLRVKNAMNQLNQNIPSRTGNIELSVKQNLENLEKLVKKTEKIARFAQILTKVKEAKEGVVLPKEESEEPLKAKEQATFHAFNENIKQLNTKIKNNKEVIKNGEKLEYFRGKNKDLNSLIENHPDTISIFLINPQMLTFFKNDNEALLLFVRGYNQLKPEQQNELLEVMKEPIFAKASLDGGNIQGITVNPKVASYLTGSFKDISMINGLFSNHLLDFKNLSKECKNLTDLAYTNFKINKKTQDTIKVDSNKKIFEIDQPENNNIQTKSNDNKSIKIAIASGYPKKSNDLTKRLGDPIADDAQSRTFKTDDGGEVVLYSGADGSNWGEHVKKAAENANAGFIQSCEEQLQNKNDKRTLIEVALEGVEAAQSEIVKGDNQTNGTTTHAGMILKKDKDGNADGVITTLGDMKAFILKKDGRVVEITKGNRGNATDARDPGGRLGLYVGTKTSAGIQETTFDKRNMSVFSFKAEEGDQVILMSDGGSDNLDPYYVANPTNLKERLYLTPEDAKKELLSSKLVSDDDKKILGNLTLSEWKDESADLGTLKEIFVSYQLKIVTQNKEDPSKAVTEFALKNISSQIQFLEDPTKGKSQAPETFPGKPDHISVTTVKV